MQVVEIPNNGQMPFLNDMPIAWHSTFTRLKAISNVYKINAFKAGDKKIIFQLFATRPNKQVILDQIFRAIPPTADKIKLDVKDYQRITLEISQPLSLLN